MKETKVRPTLDSGGLAPHGAAWGDGISVRARSRGPGVAVAVRSPGYGGPPRRVISGAGRTEFRGGTLFLVPDAAATGAEFSLTVEY